MNYEDFDGHEINFCGKLARKTIVTGHYGSGKTEFSVSLAAMLAKSRSVSLIDLDIVNPYFRSRERRRLLEDMGISVYGSVYTNEITAELPALGASARTPLEDENTYVIIDLGGNDAGAMPINQFSKYFSARGTNGARDTMTLMIVNANRPDTHTSAKVLEHIDSIEQATGLTVSALVNNTHMLHETTVNDIEKGHALCLDVCEKTGKWLLCDCYPAGVVDPRKLRKLGAVPKPGETARPLNDLTQKNVITSGLMPMGMYMSPSWRSI
ncbi:MAG: ATP-binding protein [Oscillospiraceae bacterium]|nr:ATP-binding protein [Oscillospiraceae bacterium]